MALNIVPAISGAGIRPRESGLEKDPTSPVRMRIIPRLDIKGPNLVKGVQLEGLRVLGKPERFAEYYSETGADELLLMDVVASLYERNNLHEIIRRTSAEIFIPLIVGGGLRSLDDIQAVLRAGADKVAINTAALRRPKFIAEAARRFGSSTIVVSIEAIRQRDGSYEAFTDNGRERTGVDAYDWALRATEFGAGEILITSIEREGTGLGYDLDLISRIADAVPVPVVACGGAGSIDDVVAVARKGRAQGACIASMLHYWVARHIENGDSFDESINTDHLRRMNGFGQGEEISLLGLKRALAERHILGRSLED